MQKHKYKTNYEQLMIKQAIKDYENVIIDYRVRVQLKWDRKSTT